ncbi:MAG: archease [Minisyncoccales bacterium]
MKKFEFLEHTADVKFRAYGKNLKELFENSGSALIDSIADKNSLDLKKKKKVIKLKSESLEGLIKKFLEEIIFLIESKGMVFYKVENLKVDEKNYRLEGELIFLDVENYDFHLDAKAITYNEMFVKKEKGEWVSQVVVDV